MAREYRHDPISGRVYFREEGEARWRMETGPEMAARETPGWQRPLVGAGRALTQIGQNVGELFGREVSEDRRRESARIYEGFRETYPYSSFAGEMLPGLATLPIGGGAMAAGRFVPGLLESAGLGAFFGGLQRDEGPSIAGAALGTTLGASGYLGGTLANQVVRGIQGAGRRLRLERANRQQELQRLAMAQARGAGAAGEEFIGPVQPGMRRGLDEADALARLRAQGGNTGALTPGYQRLVQKADDLGIELTPGVREGNLNMRRFEAGAQSNPWLSGIVDRVRGRNQRRYNQLAARAMGAGDDVAELTPDVMNKIADDLGKEFQKFATRVDQVDIANLPDARRNLAALLQRYSGTGEEQRQVASFLRDLSKRAERGPIPAKVLMDLRGDAVKLQQSASRQGKVLQKEGMEAAIDYVDEAMNAAMSASGKSADEIKAAQQAYEQARNRWRVLSSVEEVLTPDGNVRPLGLYQKMTRDYGTSWTRGLMTGRFGEDIGNLADALDVAKLAQDIVGSSGTAERLMANMNPADLGPMQLMMRAGQRATGEAYMAAPGAFTAGAAGAGAGADALSGFVRGAMNLPDTMGLPWALGGVGVGLGGPVGDRN